MREETKRTIHRTLREKTLENKENHQNFIQLLIRKMRQGETKANGEKLVAVEY